MRLGWDLQRCNGTTGVSPCLQVSFSEVDDLQEPRAPFLTEARGTLPGVGEAEGGDLAVSGLLVTSLQRRRPVSVSVRELQPGTGFCM